MTEAAIMTMARSGSEVSWRSGKTKHHIYPERTDGRAGGSGNHARDGFYSYPCSKTMHVTDARSADDLVVRVISTSWAASRATDNHPHLYDAAGKAVLHLVY